MFILKCTHWTWRHTHTHVHIDLSVCISQQCLLAHIWVSKYRTNNCCCFFVLSSFMKWIQSHPLYVWRLQQQQLHCMNYDYVCSFSTHCNVATEKLQLYCESVLASVCLCLYCCLQFCECFNVLTSLFLMGNSDCKVGWTFCLNFLN